MALAPKAQTKSAFWTSLLSIPRAGLLRYLVLWFLPSDLHTPCPPCHGLSGNWQVSVHELVLRYLLLLCLLFGQPIVLVAIVSNFLCVA
jgi:hypothetical protein